MMLLLRLSTAVLLAVLAAAGARAEEAAVRLTSLDWPPYAAASGLTQNGASVAVAHAAFAAAGYRLEVAFYPWQRAVQMGTADPDYAGYFPEYFSASLQDRCAFSAPMGSGPLGFAERREAPVAWTTLDDLRGIPIGTVQGYVNTDEFDARAASGALKVDAAPDDATNLRKLAAGRIGLAVIDRFVLDYLLRADPALQPHRDALAFNPRLLEDKGLFVCFQKTARGLALRQAFDAGLAKVDVAAIMRDYFAGQYTLASH